ncbi:lasso RiPP family leader peptide-containing protein [Nonomuraea spiralis]|uniref:Lasso RiPP family leader peptide-containing protein n=1 Tax=Nonomuraea spiralis TaxID=46182 RepID=A0ABV5IVP3_9ACTN|nr:lasso RiPP family leader peptide-containing protein [Nonomuraea spiralis]GGS83992.1 hypothetical protein GCM10010176_029540 [Nonomuraea spiralis]
MEQDMRPGLVKVYEPPLVAEVGEFAATTLGNLDPAAPEGTFFYRAAPAPGPPTCPATSVSAA